MRRFSGPGVLFLLGAALQMSGYQNPGLSLFSVFVALVWAGYGLAGWSRVILMRRRRPVILLVLFVTLGAVSGGLLGYVLWAFAGRAPAPTSPAPSGPKLRLATNLEANDERRIFTLSVWNDGDELAIAEASVTTLVGGQQTHEEEVPIRLGFIGKAHLSAGERGRIVVVAVDREGGVLKVGPGGYRHLAIRDAKGSIIGASFCVRADFLGTVQSEELAFRLIPDETRPLLYRAELAPAKCVRRQPKVNLPSQSEPGTAAPPRQ